MPQAQTMTLDEKLAISNKALDLWEAGDTEGYDRLMKTAPMPPYIAKVFKNSLTKAIQNFDDAFLALQAVEESCYKIAEKIYPHHKDYRVKGGFPKDSFHVACGSHKTRIQNILRSPGIDPIEKTLLKQRLANLPAAQNGYIEKQRKSLAENKKINRIGGMK